MSSRYPHDSDDSDDDTHAPKRRHDVIMEDDDDEPMMFIAGDDISSSSSDSSSGLSDPDPSDGGSDSESSSGDDDNDEIDQKNKQIGAHDVGKAVISTSMGDFDDDNTQVEVNIPVLKGTKLKKTKEEKLQQKAHKKNQRKITTIPFSRLTESMNHIQLTKEEWSCNSFESFCLKSQFIRSMILLGDQNSSGFNSVRNFNNFCTKNVDSIIIQNFRQYVYTLIEKQNNLTFDLTRGQSRFGINGEDESGQKIDKNEDEILPTYSYHTELYFLELAIYSKISMFLQLCQSYMSLVSKIDKNENDNQNNQNNQNNKHTDQDNNDEINQQDLDLFIQTSPKIIQNIISLIGPGYLNYYVNYNELILGNENEQKNENLFQKIKKIKNYFFSLFKFQAIRCLVTLSSLIYNSHFAPLNVNIATSNVSKLINVAEEYLHIPIGNGENEFTTQDNEEFVQNYAIEFLKKPQNFPTFLHFSSQKSKNFDQINENTNELISQNFNFFSIDFIELIVNHFFIFFNQIYGEQYPASKDSLKQLVLFYASNQPVFINLTTPTHNTHAYSVLNTQYQSIKQIIVQLKKELNESENNIQNNIDEQSEQKIHQIHKIEKQIDKNEQKLAQIQDKLNKLRHPVQQKSKFGGKFCCNAPINDNDTCNHVRNFYFNLQKQSSKIETKNAQHSQNSHQPTTRAPSCLIPDDPFATLIFIRDMTTPYWYTIGNTSNPSQNDPIFDPKNHNNQIFPSYLHMNTLIDQLTSFSTTMTTPSYSQFKPPNNNTENNTQNETNDNKNRNFSLEDTILLHSHPNINPNDDLTRNNGDLGPKLDHFDRNDNGLDGKGNILLSKHVSLFTPSRDQSNFIKYYPRNLWLLQDLLRSDGDSALFMGNKPLLDQNSVNLTQNDKNSSNNHRNKNTSQTSQINPIDYGQFTCLGNLFDVGFFNFLMIQRDFKRYDGQKVQIGMQNMASNIPMQNMAPNAQVQSLPPKTQQIQKKAQTFPLFLSLQLSTQFQFHYMGSTDINNLCYVIENLITSLFFEFYPLGKNIQNKVTNLHEFEQNNSKIISQIINFSKQNLPEYKTIDQFNTTPLHMFQLFNPIDGVGTIGTIAAQLKRFNKAFFGAEKDGKNKQIEQIDGEQIDQQIDQQNESPIPTSTQTKIWIKKVTDVIEDINYALLLSFLSNTLLKKALFDIRMNIEQDSDNVRDSIQGRLISLKKNLLKKQIFENLKKQFFSSFSTQIENLSTNKKILFFESIIDFYILGSYYSNTYKIPILPYSPYLRTNFDEFNESVQSWNQIKAFETYLTPLMAPINLDIALDASKTAYLSHLLKNLTLVEHSTRNDLKNGQSCTNSEKNSQNYQNYHNYQNYVTLFEPILAKSIPYLFGQLIAKIQEYTTTVQKIDSSGGVSSNLYTNQLELIYLLFIIVCIIIQLVLISENLKKLKKIISQEIEKQNRFFRIENNVVDKNFENNVVDKNYEEVYSAQINYLVEIILYSVQIPDDIPPEDNTLIIDFKNLISNKSDKSVKNSLILADLSKISTLSMTSVLIITLKQWKSMVLSGRQEFHHRKGQNANEVKDNMSFYHPIKGISHPFLFSLHSAMNLLLFFNFYNSNGNNIIHFFSKIQLFNNFENFSTNNSHQKNNFENNTLDIDNITINTRPLSFPHSSTATNGYEFGMYLMVEPGSSQKMYQENYKNLKNIRNYNLPKKHKNNQNKSNSDDNNPFLKLLSQLPSPPHPITLTTPSMATVVSNTDTLIQGSFIQRFIEVVSNFSFPIFEQFFEQKNDQNDENDENNNNNFFAQKNSFSLQLFSLFSHSISLSQHCIILSLSQFLLGTFRNAIQSLLKGPKTLFKSLKKNLKIELQDSPHSEHSENSEIDANTEASDNIDEDTYQDSLAQPFAEASSTYNVPLGLIINTVILSFGQDGPQSQNTGHDDQTDQTDQTSQNDKKNAETIDYVETLHSLLFTMETLSWLMPQYNGIYASICINLQLPQIFIQKIPQFSDFVQFCVDKSAQNYQQNQNNQKTPQQRLKSQDILNFDIIKRSILAGVPYSYIPLYNSETSPPFSTAQNSIFVDNFASTLLLNGQILKDYYETYIISPLNDYINFVDEYCIGKATNCGKDVQFALSHPYRFALTVLSSLYNPIDPNKPKYPQLYAKFMMPGDDKFGRNYQNEQNFPLKLPHVQTLSNSVQTTVKSLDYYSTSLTCQLNYHQSPTYNYNFNNNHNNVPISNEFINLTQNFIKNYHKSDILFKILFTFDTINKINALTTPLFSTNSPNNGHQYYSSEQSPLFINAGLVYYQLQLLLPDLANYTNLYHSPTLTLNQTSMFPSHWLSLIDLYQHGIEKRQGQRDAYNTRLNEQYQAEKLERQKLRLNKRINDLERILGLDVQSNNHGVDAKGHNRPLFAPKHLPLKEKQSLQIQLSTLYDELSVLEPDIVGKKRLLEIDTQSISADQGGVENGGVNCDVKSNKKQHLDTNINSTTTPIDNNTMCDVDRNHTTPMHGGDEATRHIQPKIVIPNDQIVFVTYLPQFTPDHITSIINYQQEEFSHPIPANEVNHPVMTTADEIVSLFPVSSSTEPSQPPTTSLTPQEEVFKALHTALMATFSQFGSIYCIVLPLHNITRLPRGSCKVLFNELSGAQNALKAKKIKVEAHFENITVSNTVRIEQFTPIEHEHDKHHQNDRRSDVSRQGRFKDGQFGNRAGDHHHGVRQDRQDSHIDRNQHQNGNNFDNKHHSRGVDGFNTNRHDNRHPNGPNRRFNDSSRNNPRYFGNKTDKSHQNGTMNDGEDTKNTDSVPKPKEKTAEEKRKARNAILGIQE